MNSWIIDLSPKWHQRLNNGGAGTGQPTDWRVANDIGLTGREPMEQPGQEWKIRRWGFYWKLIKWRQVWRVIVCQVSEDTHTHTHIFSFLSLHILVFSPCLLSSRINLSHATQARSAEKIPESSSHEDHFKTVLSFVYCFPLVYLCLFCSRLNTKQHRWQWRWKIIKTNGNSLIICVSQL